MFVPLPEGPQETQQQSVGCYRERLALSTSYQILAYCTEVKTC